MRYRAAILAMLFLGSSLFMGCSEQKAPPAGDGKTQDSTSKKGSTKRLETPNGVEPAK